MNLLIGVTYYHPHISGLTLYVQRLAELLAAEGHRVTVLTSRHDSSLPLREVHGGVEIRRIPASVRISKGLLMLRYLPVAWRLLKRQDIVLLNLPCGATEAFLPLLVRLRRKPTIATYHCAIQLPRGWTNRLVQAVVEMGDWIGLTLADRIVGYTEDYAAHTPALMRRSGKLQIIPPPVIVFDANGNEVEAFRNQHAPGGENLIGFAARFATEKGIEVALDALQRIKEEVGPARILFAGEYRDVIGEKLYWEQMQPLVVAAGDSWQFLGPLSSVEMGIFYRGCDVLILPSTNRTESFGLVQVESMLCGTPVVASDLPGVRVPVSKTGMGRLSEVGNPESLAAAVIDVLLNRPLYSKPRDVVERHFSTEKTVAGYIGLFNELTGNSSALDGIKHEMPRSG